jgi:phosphohistidine swiveling domain-containing protein
MKKDIQSKLKSVNWDVQQFNGYPFFLSSAAMLSGFECLPWGENYEHFLSISKNKNVKWHYDIADYDRAGRVFWSKIKSSKDLSMLIDKYRREYVSSLRFAKYNEKDLSKKSITDLKQLLKKQINLLKASGGVAHIIECASFVGEKILKSDYPEGVMINSSAQSFLGKASLFAKRLVQNDTDEKDILTKFNKNYGWIKNSYLGRNQISKKDIIALAKKAKSFKPHKEKDEFLKIMSVMFSWQDERKANLLKSIHSSELVLFELAKKVSLPKTSAVFLLPDEVDKVENLEFHKELRSRASLFIDYSKNNKEALLLTGAEAELFVREYEDKHEEILSIKGSVAYKGKITGKVRICLSLESIKSFREGEVLVASMTRPEYLNAMQKAVAFVTDEGGITCHAAIIARELKKPCVIGTKIATKVLKDGDLVEVDAERGIVTILK